MRTQALLAGVFFVASFTGSAGEPPTRPGVANPPPPGKASDQTYQVRWLPGAQIAVDGQTKEAAWQKAVVETNFTFPWKRTVAPETEFRALCDGTDLYFTFRVQDKDVVALDRLRDKEDEVFEDRVEVCLSRDDEMKHYYCLEVDSRGRVFDYSGSFYRRLDSKWHCDGLETKGAPTATGYEVEGRIPLESLKALGFPTPRPGVRIRCGLYRAEFSHDRSGRKVEPKESIHNLGRKVEGPPPIEEWISWVDPKIKEPDFHLPATLGWLEFVE